MHNLLIRRIPKETISLAKKMAEKHHRSLQEEISQLLIQSVHFHAGEWSKKSGNIYKRLARSGKHFSDSASLLRDDRDR
ncbi:MAG: Arc family DNA-binding protein [Elusimicrobia bacterium]|nr:Arc family DNA-binding protein [Elusimicrobiota bacterium]